MFQSHEILFGTRTIAAAGDNPVQRKSTLAAGTQVAFKNCVPFKDYRTEVNDTFVDYADFINISMPMLNLIEYKNKYSDGSGVLIEMIQFIMQMRLMIIMLLHLSTMET